MEVHTYRIYRIYRIFYGRYEDDALIISLDCACTLPFLRDWMLRIAPFEVQIESIDSLYNTV